MTRRHATAAPGVTGAASAKSGKGTGKPSFIGSSTLAGPTISPAAVPTTAPMRASRPTSGSRQRPDSARCQEISISGQRRRAKGSSAT